MLLQETDNPGTTIEEYVQFETERALRNGKVYNWETAKYGMVNWCLDEVDIDILRFFEPKFPAIFYNDALKLKPDPSFNQIFNHVLDRIENESCNNLKVEYLFPNEEWKCLELEKMPPSNASYEYIEEYGLMINDDDLEYMFDYLLAKDGPSFMDVEKEEMEGIKSMMIGTPSDRAENFDKEFNDWARDNGFVNTSGCDDVELVKK
ncbi:hypothetical protein Tco_0260368 [Tanacetum coccineum]